MEEEELLKSIFRVKDELVKEWKVTRALSLEQDVEKGKGKDNGMRPYPNVPMHEVASPNYCNVPSYNVKLTLRCMRVLTHYP
jgi:hypothetical protein